MLSLSKSVFNAVSAGLLLALSPVLLAHHSTAAYDSAKESTMKGVVSEVRWVNPHSYIVMVVSDGKGQAVKWTVLSGTPTLNIRNGWKYDDVKVGDTVTVVVNPSRDPGLHAGILRRITLADGRSIAGPREFLAVPSGKQAGG